MKRLLFFTITLFISIIHVFAAGSHTLTSTERRVLIDSVWRAAQQQEIDSLRPLVKGVPVVIEQDTLFTLYASMGGRAATDRVERIVETIEKLGKEHYIKGDSIHFMDNLTYIDIMYGDKVLMSLTLQDAMWAKTTKEKLADHYGRLMGAKITYLRNEHSFWKLLKRGTLFLSVLLGQYVIFRLINHLFKLLRRWIVYFKRSRMLPWVVHNYEVLNRERIARVLLFITNLLRYVILASVLVFTVPILFSIFPQTEGLATQIFDYIIDPVKMIVKGVIDYIPNLFIIIVICFCVRYLVKGFRYLSREVATEKLHIPGFYPEWAQPTFNIIRFLLYAFMVAMIYPYLPGSKSGVFQGISVFVGVIVSLGSSTVISNFISGFVITYMRPFKSGDFIKVKDTLGTVVERTPFVTRIRTIKNELVTIPNSFIMSSDTVNYTVSAQRYGLIIHTVMTMGYDVPWRKVHELLIKAAEETPGVSEYPKPFVLELDLNDNYMCYQINAYIKEADKMPDIMSTLLERIQDLFHDAEIDLVAPHYFSRREGAFPKEGRAEFRRIHSLD
ncbi:MAG: mechanosensitive ion channel family protein [Bacteroidales bacterium]|nr:mechanosensitive ion channel family protein [Bacteroidales bacterium]